MKEVLIKKLNQFNYKFKVANNKVTIFTNTALEVVVHFNEGKVIVEDFLRRLLFRNSLK